MSKFVLTITVVDEDGTILAVGNTDDNAKHVITTIIYTGYMAAMQYQFQDLDMTIDAMPVLLTEGDSLTLVPTGSKDLFIEFGKLHKKEET